jgi:carbon-monoxide dehydrogenase small subunit
MSEFGGTTMKRNLKMAVNGEQYDLDVYSNKTLLDVLREDLGLTGAKRGCDEGACGACTVILDGKAVNSCSLLAMDGQGKNILTIEGLASGDELHPLQDSFMRHGAVQCGYCTPGMILSAAAFLDENDDPSEGDVREAISGNICRCTGYVKIVDATLAAAMEIGK